MNTLSNKLCKSGCVEKGVLGELGARILLLIARDFAAPVTDKGRNFLQPVRLLEFLSSLLGSNSWAGTNNQPKFDDAFRDAHVNFTHWIMTKDCIPEGSQALNPCVYTLYYPYAY